MGMYGSYSGILFNGLEHTKKEDIRSFLFIYLCSPKNAYLLRGTEPEPSVLFSWKSLGMSGRTNLNYDSVPLLSLLDELF